MHTEKILAVLEEYKQRNILAHYRQLPKHEQTVFLNNLRGLDLELVFKLHREFREQKTTTGRKYDIQPAPIIRIPATEAEKAQAAEARQTGEEMLRRGETAVLIVAGGQGSRLGYPGPKGTFPISPVKDKTLFQLFAETVSALQTKYQAMIPLLIMTSRENRADTEAFFHRNRSFGLHSENVHFFEQDILPSITPEGNLILKDETHIFANPDGHGGSLKALAVSGMLERIQAQGCREIFYCQVDNPLVRVADPVFLGWHRRRRAEMSLKVLQRRDGAEKIGIYGLVDGKPTVVEYSDLSPEEMRAVDEQGNLRYWAGSIAIHIISLAFVRRLSQGLFQLPFHRAIKSVPALDSAGRPEMTTAWKFETFVFDGLPLAGEVCCLETLRSEEFAPVKNPDGEDSPAVARAALSALHRSWLEKAGRQVKKDARVEISPLYALNAADAADKIRADNLPGKIAKDIYLG